MKYHATRPCQILITCIIVILLAGCTPVPPPAAPAAEPEGLEVGMLIFGDSGYHLDYPDQDDYVELFTTEGFYQDEWNDWLEKKRRMDEFEPRGSSISPVTGKVVAASGMKPISTAMKHFCKAVAVCDFGVMLGDNIYPSGSALGADGFDEAKRYKDMFTDPFGSLVESPASYLTYATLGNHDWESSREGGFAQMEFLKNADGFYMDGPYYTVKPPAGNGEIELFVIDTSMILASTTVYEDYLNDDGSELETDEVDVPDYHTEPLTAADREQPQWLEAALRSSTAKWKFVIGHHPVWSSGGTKFQESKVLRKMILPAICRYADAYIVGHEHTLEIHTDSCEAALGEATDKPLVEIISGAASKQRPAHTTFIQHQELKYPEHKTVMAKGLRWGFAHMIVEDDTAEITLMRVPNDGSSEISVELVYQFNRRSHLNQ